jgi:hypothetical protein
MVQYAQSLPTLNDRYSEMCHILELARQGDEEGDTLEAGIYALSAVANFLDGDPAIRSVSRPFLKIVNAMHDVLQGARPPLFTPSPKVGGGRPTNLSHHAARAAVVHALDLLMAVPKHERPTRLAAGRFVADEVRKAGIDAFGTNITARQILIWRDESGSRAPDLTTEMHKRLAELQRTLPAIDGLGAARHAVRDLIAGIRRGGF